MGIIDKIKDKFHHDADNTNRMMSTENNQQQFGVDTDDKPRNHLLDTISNEQGAEILGKKNNPNLQYENEAINKNILTHTLSNEQAEDLAKGIDIKKDDSNPRNKLLDIQPNEEFRDIAKDEIETEPATKVNSDRLL